MTWSKAESPCFGRKGLNSLVKLFFLQLGVICYSYQNPELPLGWKLSQNDTRCDASVSWDLLMRKISPTCRALIWVLSTWEKRQKLSYLSTNLGQDFKFLCDLPSKSIFSSSTGKKAKSPFLPTAW